MTGGGTPLKRPVIRCAWCGELLREGLRLVPIGRVLTCSEECRTEWVTYASSDVTEEEVDRCLERLAAEIPPTGETKKRARFRR